MLPYKGILCEMLALKYIERLNAIQSFAAEWFTIEEMIAKM